MVVARYMLLIRVVDKTLHVMCIVHMTVHVVIASSVYLAPSLIIYTVKYSSISESQIYAILAVLNIATLMMIPLNA